MSKPSRDARSSSAEPPVNAATFMVGTIADTTWRMFIPSIGGTLLGLWADRSWGTTPWLMIAGIALGATIAGLLVWRQLTAQPNTEDTTTKS